MTTQAGPWVTASVVAAKTLRVFTRTPQLMGATLGQGILFLLVFRYVFGGAIDTGALSYVDFMTPGILTAAVLFAAAGAAVGVAEDRADGFIDRVRSMPASRTGLILGRCLADTVIVTVAAAVTLLIAVAVGFRPQARAGHLMLAAALLMVFALAFAALFGALGAVADGPQTAQSLGFVAIPLTFVSSAYVPTETMPGWLSAVAANQPVTHMIEVLRQLMHAEFVAVSVRESLLAVVWAVVIATASMAWHRAKLAASNPG